MKRTRMIMVKHAICIVLSLPLLVLGCQRPDETTPNEKNRLISLSPETKTGSVFYMVSEVGHDGSKCPGCVFEAGQLVHVDCQGDGSQCNITASVTLQQVGTDITATTTDTFGLTSLDFFNMPARSLSTGEGGDNAYLNIPAQLVERDTTTLQFTFTGLFYTNKPEYNNF